MPVEKYAEEYNMNHNRRGKAVIFNHDEFKNKSPRPGSAVDVRILKETYEALGFEVVVYENLKCADIQSAITERKFKQVFFFPPLSLSHRAFLR
jgi:caspase-like apoptosis-related cysteine protease